MDNILSYFNEKTPIPHGQLDIEICIGSQSLDIDSVRYLLSSSRRSLYQIRSS